MNIFWKLTRKTMRENRVRTAATIVGVILSAAMFTAVTTLCVSMVAYLREAFIWSYGNYHVCRYQLTGEEYAAMTGDERTEASLTSRTIGYAPMENESADMPYLLIDAVDDGFLESMPVHLTQGRMPENSRELLLPDHLYTRGNVQIKPGQVLELQVGQRYSDGELLNEQLDFEENETLEDLTDYRFTVVGTYEEPTFESYKSPGYMALTLDDGQIAQRGILNVYLRLDHPARNLQSFLEDYDSFGVVGSINNSLLAAEGANVYRNYSSILYGMGGVLIFLIMTGSVSMIYSAFSISVSDRTRQFGLLSSVGASRKQLRKCIRQEALLVGAVGIPVGIGCGLLGIWITIWALQDQFRSLMAAKIVMEMKVEPLAIAVAAAVAFLTIWISAWIPSRRAMRVTAIEAIRQNQDIYQRQRPVRMSGPMLRLFGIEGLLAKKYFHRSRKSYRGTIVSLAFSVMIFIASAAYGQTLFQAVGREIYLPVADLIYQYGSAEEKEQMNAWLSQEETVEDSVWVRSDTVYIGKDENYVEEQYYLDNHMEIADDGSNCWAAQRCFVDDEAYRRILETYRLDEAQFLGKDNPPAILVNQGKIIRYGDGSTRSVVEYRYVKEETRRLTVVERKDYPSGIPKQEQSRWYSLLTWEEDTGSWILSYENADGRQRQEKAGTHQIPVGAKIYDSPLGTYEGTLIYPMSACPESLKEATTGEIYMKTKDHDTALEKLEQYLEEHQLGRGDAYLIDLYEREKDNRNIVILVEVLSIGFTVLMILITAANVFHTISTSINLRRRDFAMLGSAGMSPREMNRMLNYECLIYGIKSLIYGIPMGILMNLAIQHVLMNAELQTITVAWQIYPAAILLVWILVWITTRYARTRLRRHSLLDDLKNDNI